MKLSRFFVIGALVALSLPMLAAVAKADGLPPGDPIYKTGGDPPLPGEEPESIISTNFTIACASGTCPAEPNDGSSPCELIQFGGASTQFSPSCFFQKDVATLGVARSSMRSSLTSPGPIQAKRYVARSKEIRRCLMSAMWRAMEGQARLYLSRLARFYTGRISSWIWKDSRAEFRAPYTPTYLSRARCLCLGSV